MPAREDQLRQRRFIENCENVDIRLTQNRSTELPAGVYMITSSVSFYFLQGDNTVTASATAPFSNPVWANSYAEFHVVNPSEDGYVSVIRDSSGADGDALILKPQP